MVACTLEELLALDITVSCMSRLGDGGHDGRRAACWPPRCCRFPPPVAVAISTLAAAALFSLLRNRVQQAADRRFNWPRNDADRTVTTFAGRLHGTSTSARPAPNCSAP